LSMTNPLKPVNIEGRSRRRGGQEHAEIIGLYLEGHSINKIARELGRSKKTVKDHIDNHNWAVERSSFCPSCRRVHSEHESKATKRV
jgi:uncharacterized protein YjcR